MESTTNDVCPNTPNADTVATMMEAERIARDPTVKRYDVEEALVELKK